MTFHAWQPCIKIKKPKFTAGRFSERPTCVKFEKPKCRALNGIKARGFFGKNIKKHICCHDKNYYYFFKSNITVINLIVGSRKL